MATLYFSPNWFYWYSLIFEAIFALTTALIAIYSFKVYSLAKQKESELFGIGFSLVSASYVIWFFINLFLLDQLQDGIQVLDFGKIAFLGTLGVYSHIFLFILGLLTIAYITFKTDNIKTYSLLVILTISGIVMSLNKATAFYIFTSIFLIFIMLYYLTQFLRKRNPKTLLVLISFILLSISHIQYIFASNNYIYYVAGHFLELIAYLILLVQLYHIIKNS
jgi:TRAP-type C4-dicarboxylate transport system permease small subunit